MMQIVWDKDFRIIHARGPQYGIGVAWVVYRTKTFPEEPAVFTTLEEAIEYIKECAGLKQSPIVVHPASGTNATK